MVMCIFLNADYGGLCKLFQVTKIANKQILVWGLHLETVQVNYIVLKESILDSHLH